MARPLPAFADVFLVLCSGLKFEADGSRVQVALKHLFSPHHVNSVEREAGILQDVSGRGYTVPFYDMFKEQPGNLQAGTPHTAQTAWLVTGYAKQDAAASCHCDSLNATWENYTGRCSVFCCVIFMIFLAR